LFRLAVDPLDHWARLLSAPTEGDPMTDEAERVAVTVDVGESGVLVRAVGEFDMATARFLDEALRNAADNGASRVTIDLGGVPFMDSSGLHPIVQLMRREPPIAVTVINAQPGIDLLFELHGIGSLMTKVVA
jgi:anti-anti-sigma factor